MISARTTINVQIRENVSLPGVIFPPTPSRTHRANFPFPPNVRSSSLRPASSKTRAATDDDDTTRCAA
ncbi:hypothetical protein BDZ89DRAFT_1070478 [Hymenopellis radicata]|nr:hypothetical protein BDZ89DRAFT_1070478 [Hymenopellis radicata]